MVENKKNEEVQSIEDKDLDKVTGGGFFSAYSNERYAEAGVEVIGAGSLWNDGYKLVNSQ
ncbi:MAG: hypothetical protein IJJ00_04930 [Erysipelotrichaceae bacterium]|nr:hypothetical protein [Erysipelotrichaceae bacterium]